jgi:hypothetical protein
MSGQYWSPEFRHRQCDSVLPDQGYRTSQRDCDRQVESNGGMMISREKPKKLAEGPTPVPLNSLRISHTVGGYVDPDLRGEKTAV